jgi:NTE family protein
LKPKIGLVLGGGGSRGSYQVGIVKALKDEGVFDSISCISGTSIGAINTMMVMANISYEKTIELWERIDNEHIYGTGWNILKPDRLKEDKQGLYSLSVLYEKLSKEIPLNKIRNSRLKGFATAAKIKKESLVEQMMIHKMEKRVFNLNTCDDPHKAVLASASIPVLFGSTEINEEFFVDGGIIDNCPIEPLLEEGCNIIITVPIDGLFKPKKFKNNDVLIVDIETKKLFGLIPIDILDFKPIVVKSKAKYGYLMAKQMISKLRELKILDEKNKWHKKTGYELIQITKDEESQIKFEVDHIWT